MIVFSVRSALIARITGGNVKGLSKEKSFGRILKKDEELP